MTRRRRRPSGEPPPLPHAPGWRTALAAIIAVVVAGIVLTAAYAKGVPPLDDEILEAAAELRDTWVADVAEVLSWFAEPFGTTILRLVLIATLVVVMRSRHLVLALIAFSVMDLLLSALTVSLPAPEVGTVGTTSTFYFPAYPVAGLAITVAAMAFALAPVGTARRRALWGAALFIAAVVVSRMILGQTYPIAALYSAFLGFAIAPALFDFFAPDDTFPVTYRRGGSSAHLALDEGRVAAVIGAVGRSAGVDVVRVEPFGAGGLRRLDAPADERRGRLAGLRQALRHEARPLGPLVPGRPHGALRTPRGREPVHLGAAPRGVRGLLAPPARREGFRVAQPTGSSSSRRSGNTCSSPSSSPARRPRARRGGRRSSTKGCSSSAKLWDTGLAHRDLKPANLLSSITGSSSSIPPSLEVRPSPWRQAVDLANMMLVLALRSDPDRVFQRAMASFTPDEVAEAFASAVGMAIRPAPGAPQGDYRATCSAGSRNWRHRTPRCRSSAGAPGASGWRSPAWPASC